MTNGHEILLAVLGFGILGLRILLAVFVRRGVRLLRRKGRTATAPQR